MKEHETPDWLGIEAQKREREARPQEKEHWCHELCFTKNWPKMKLNKQSGIWGSMGQFCPCMNM